MAEKLGGYDHKFIEPIPDDFICLICTFVARDPQQLTCCGKLFCTNCLEELGEDKPCPHCREEGWKSFPDKRSARCIMALNIKCSHSSEGCDWTGELREQYDHTRVCDYELIDCENDCWDLKSHNITKIMRMNSRIHLLKECILRFVQCKYCNKEGRYHFIIGDHYNECPEVLMECSNEGCEEMIKRRQLKDGTHDCEYELVKCKYAEYGCALIPKKFKQEHERDTDLHLELTLKVIDGLTKRLEKLEDTDRMSKAMQAKTFNAVTTIDQHVQKLDCNIINFKKQFRSQFIPQPLDSALDHPEGLAVATFKMENYDSHRTDGTTFISPSFYTSQDGYKMKVKVKPINTYLSFIIELIPGENDDYLTWPISNACIEVDILNQKMNKKHIATRFNMGGDRKAKLNIQPVYSSLVFRNPVHLNSLTHEYTCNNTLYFRVTVHKIPAANKPWLVCTV